MADSYRPDGGGGRRLRPVQGAARGDSYKPAPLPPKPQQPPTGYNTTVNVPSGDFSFRSSVQAPQFNPINAGAPGTQPVAFVERYPSRSGRHHSQRGTSNTANNSRNHNNNNRRRDRIFRSQKAHERPLMLSQSNDAEEQRLGVGEDSHRFDVNSLDLSDSETETSSGADDPHNGGKKARVVDKGSADGDSVPKWSNPDPYTVLPPPSETTGKRIDFVQLIRKAKAGQADEAPKDLAKNEDFIAFDLPGEDAAPFVGSLNDIPSLGPATEIADRSSHRTVDGEPRPTTHKRKRGEDRGGIIAEWQVNSRSDPTPWLPKAPGKVHPVDQMLHNEIMDFYDFVAPTPHEGRVRQAVIRKATDVLHKTFFSIKAKTIAFGSFPSSLYLPTADLDLSFVSQNFYDGGPPNRELIKKGAVYKVAQSLKRNRIADEDTVQPIANARVPIVKYVDRKTLIQVDISLENVSGYDANRTVRKWKQTYKDLPYLVVLVKQFLLMRGLNEVHSGGLGGFAIVCLVVAYLHGKDPDEYHLGQLLLGFFNFYGNVFDLTQSGIRMDPPSFVPKGRLECTRRAKPNQLCIEDPNNPDNNITGGSSNITLIFKAFSDAYAALVDHMITVEPNPNQKTSVLQAVFAGNYASYIEQRNRLNKIEAPFIKDNAPDRPTHRVRFD